MATFENAESALDYTQGLRKRLVDEMTKESLPIDKDNRLLLLSSLNDIDKQVLMLKKIASDEKTADTDRKVALMIAKYNTKATRDQFAGNGEGVIPEPNLDPLSPLEGETEIGLSSEDVTAFLTKFEDQA